MAKARKVVLDSNRLGKRLKDLAVGGYKLRQEIVTCNKDNFLSHEDLDICSIDVDTKYPIEKIEMYFYSPESAKRLVIEAVGGQGKIVLEDIDYSDKLVESDEEYSLFDGDDVPDSDAEGNRLSRFRLCLNSPIMYNVLYMYELVMDNAFYFDVFNNYEYLCNSRSAENGAMIGLDRKYASEINVLLLNNGFKSVGNYIYISSNGDSKVVLQFMGNSFNLFYTDRFVRSEPNTLDSYKEEFSEELIVGDFAKNVLQSPKFNAVMLNGEINNAEFNLSDLDLDVILSELSIYGYHIDNLGLACVGSMNWFRVVCGFRGESSYLYVQFYFDTRECQLKVRILSSEARLSRLDCEGVNVFLVDVDCSNEDTTTLIKGFDLGNFKEHSLV